ncbi:MAG: ATP-grasp domain-containing protein [Tumebacillaceae bacterium]
MDFVRACRRNAIEPILFLSKPDEQPSWVMDDYYAEGVAIQQVNGYDADELLEACKRLAQQAELVAVLSLYEYSTAHAAQAASSLGLRSPDPDVVRRVRDKAQFRRFVFERQLDDTRFLAIDARSSGEVVWPHDYPVVVKPVNLTGSAFVRHCRNEAELQTALREIGCLSEYTGQAVDSTVLIEEYIGGSEFSVEVLNGSVIGIVRKYTTDHPGFIEVGHDVPSDIGPDVEQSIKQSVQQFLTEVGYRFGLMHIELKHNESGVHFIEANPRVAGGRIPELIRLTQGVDMIEAYLLSLAGGESAVQPRSSGEYASIRFLVAEEEGVFEGYREVDPAEHPLITEHKFYKTVGDAFQINHSNRDRIVHAVAVSDSIERNESAIDAFFDAMQIREVVR